MPTVLITGGTGTIGKKLSQLLVTKGYDVIIFSRQQPNTPSSAGINYALWDVEKGTIDKAAISKADYIIHLAGAGVADKRWTDKRKKEILESRTQSSLLIAKALAETVNKVKAVVSASATGWYGEDTATSKQKGFTEEWNPATDFLGKVCKQWEHSIENVTKTGQRLVKLRTGIVLSNDGGAYIEFKKPLKAGIAAILGSGDQTVSWIQVDDLCRMYVYAMENESLSGAYNAVAPAPVSNKTLTLELAKQMRGKSFIPIHAPAFVLKLMLGELSIEVLKSATVSSEKIKKAGFIFLYPSIEAAIKLLLSE